MPASSGSGSIRFTDPLRAPLTRESPRRPFQFCACRRAVSWKFMNHREHRMRWSFFVRPITTFGGLTFLFPKRSFPMEPLQRPGCANCGSIECNAEALVGLCSCHAIGVGEVAKAGSSTWILQGIFKSLLYPGKVSLRIATAYKSPGRLYGIVKRMSAARLVPPVNPSAPRLWM